MQLRCTARPPTAQPSLLPHVQAPRAPASAAPWPRPWRPTARHRRRPQRRPQRWPQRRPAPRSPRPPGARNQPALSAPPASRAVPLPGDEGRNSSLAVQNWRRPAGPRLDCALISRGACAAAARAGPRRLKASATSEPHHDQEHHHGHTDTDVPSHRARQAPTHRKCRPHVLATAHKTAPARPLTAPVSAVICACACTIMSAIAFCASSAAVAPAFFAAPSSFCGKAARG